MVSIPVVHCFYAHMCEKESVCIHRLYLCVCIYTYKLSIYLPLVKHCISLS